MNGKDFVERWFLKVVNIFSWDVVEEELIWEGGGGMWRVVLFVTKNGK